MTKKITIMEMYFGLLKDTKTLSYIKNYLELIRQKIETMILQSPTITKVHGTDSLLEKRKETIKNFIAYIVNNPEDVNFIVYDFLKKQYNLFLTKTGAIYDIEEFEYDHLIIDDKVFFDNLSTFYKRFETDIINVVMESTEKMTSVEKIYEVGSQFLLFLNCDIESINLTNEMLSYLFTIFNNNYVYTQFNLTTNNYLYEVNYDYIEYHYANNYFNKNYYNQFYNNTTNNDNNNDKNEQKDEFGRVWKDCSVIYKNGILGRNYDFLYNENKEFIIKVSNKYATYKSIGVANIGNEITPNIVRLAPFLTIDGMNEQGVKIAMTIKNAKTNKEQSTVGVNENSPFRFCALMIPRYVLDFCATAEEAIEKIKQLNIFCPYSKEYSSEFAYMITDNNKQFIVEFINNKLIYKELTTTDKKYMTNFTLLNEQGEFKIEFDNQNNIKYNTVDSYESGIERYNFITQNIEMIDINYLLEQLSYSNTYTLEPVINDNVNPLFWFSEYSNEKLNLDNKKLLTDYQSYLEEINKQKEKYDNKTRDENSEYFGIRHTKHTSIYENNTLTIKVQEQDTFNYTL